jgi:chromate reductase, NAD(P)H dehydrogenase (quinone)
MKILGISGSLKSASSNTALLHAAARLAKENMEITVFESLGELPLFNPDIDGDVPPAAVKKFRDALRAADGILISTPEYAFGVPGSLKNAIDWTVSSGEFVDKPVAVISASPSYLAGENAYASLLLTLSALSSNVPEDGKLMVGEISKKIDADGNLTDPDTAEQIRSVLDALSSTVEANPPETSI